MSQQYRFVVHCDENRTGNCRGLVEYTSPDRIGLSREADRHRTESGWLWGYRNRTSIDVCPECQKVAGREPGQA